MKQEQSEQHSVRDSGYSWRSVPEPWTHQILRPDEEKYILSQQQTHNKVNTSSHSNKCIVKCAVSNSYVTAIYLEWVYAFYLSMRRYLQIYSEYTTS